MIKAVIFDLFGTLIAQYSKNRNERFFDSVSKLLKVRKSEFVSVWNKSGKAASTGQFENTKENFREIFKALQIDFTPEALEQAVHLKLDMIREFMADMQPGVEECLDYLQQNGYQIGLISNCGPDVPELWEEFPIRSYFEYTAFSPREKCLKPDERIYRICAKRLGVNLTECIYVADGGNSELSAALALGMKPILVEPDLNDVYDPDRIDVTEWIGSRINSFAELKNQIERISRDNTQLQL